MNFEVGKARVINNYRNFGKVLFILEERIDRNPYGLKCQLWKGRIVDSEKNRNKIQNLLPYLQVVLAFRTRKSFALDNKNENN
jgi:hypothetical protein